MALTDNQKKANKLGIKYTDTTTDEMLSDLIEQKERQNKQDEQEDQIKEANAKKAETAKKKSKLILRNIDGEDVDEKDYFISGEVENPVTKLKEKVIAPAYFNQICGMPVDREDMIEVFKKVFGESASEFLFYKSNNKEIYIIIVPLRRATTVGASEDSLPGDFQKHAISFIGEGSVNLDTLKLKLRKVLTFLKRSE